ncbi:hypothetical protein F8154_03505 [Alkaliphilus pronyensis]|uniref:Uncharacterized protein n=1 Tax=Alkaliphilus pronyensis TaxID=1482732 RepID=A0A6I0FE71_9FIRM|nr:hypothetical protein [Alkaliphilus pronyensis]KAB3537369.1 hypothetical protein F8154_03505 [Alkaliphilus pronyensis]
MIKNNFKLCITLIVLLLSVNLGFAAYQEDSFKAKLIINYGETVTQSNLVILDLEVVEENIKDISYVKFSLDKENWIGYDKKENKWKDGFTGSYQKYYTDFDIGEIEGLKTVYVKIVDNKGQDFYTSGEITYSPEENTPAVNEATPEVTTAGNHKQSGSSSNPYVISKNNTAITLSTENVKVISLSIDGEDFTEWKAVSNKKEDIEVVFDGTEGEKLVYVRSRNSYGIEGNIYQIHFLIDKTPPDISITSNYYRLAAADGSLDFDLHLFDSLSPYVDFYVEVLVNNEVISQQGKVKMYMEEEATISRVSISNLPKEDFKLNIIATDEAGNKTTKAIDIESY